MRKSRYYNTPTAVASSWYVCGSYDDYAESDFDDDYAVIRFSSDISKYWFAIDTTESYGEDAYLCGYPKDKADVQNRLFEQWCASGPLVAYGKNIIEH